MLTFYPFGKLAPDDLWAWSVARYSIGQAAGALEDVVAALRPLVDASDWHAEGVRMLHECIVEMTASTTNEIAQVLSRQWEIEAARPQ